VGVIEELGAAFQVTKLANESSSERSRPVDSVAHVYPVTYRNVDTVKATRRLVGGALATPSTALKLNIY
jgi:hypothetical protein